MNEFNKDHDRISAFMWNEESIRVYGHGKGKAMLEVRRNEKKMKKQEAEAELKKIIEEFANRHNLFLLNINYEGYHECDIDSMLEESYCSFITEKCEVEIG